MHRTAEICILIACATCGCNQDNKRLTALESKVRELDATMTATDAKISFTDTRLESLETESLDNHRPKSASFKPTEKGYQNIHTDSGILMISLEDIKPYANGYKATFHFGNPQSIDFDNVEINLRWGPARPTDGFKTIKLSDWQKQFQRNKQKLGKRLRSGSWNPIEIVIAPATAEQVGTIDIESLSVPTVFMRSP